MNRRPLPAGRPKKDIEPFLLELKDEDKYAYPLLAKYPSEAKLARKLGLVDYRRGKYGHKMLHLLGPDEKRTLNNLERYAEIRAYVDTLEGPVAVLNVWDHFQKTTDFNFTKLDVEQALAHLASRGEMTNLKEGTREYSRYAKTHLFTLDRRVGGHLVRSYKTLITYLHKAGETPLTPLTRKFGYAKIKAAETEKLICRKEYPTHTVFTLTPKGWGYQSDDGDVQAQLRGARRENILNTIPDTPTFTAKMVADRLDPRLPVWVVVAELGRLVHLKILRIASVRRGNIPMQYQYNPEYP